MSEQQAKQTRPPQVTAAGLIVMLGAVFVILLMWDRVSHLNTPATQTSLKEFLDRSKLRDDGVGLDAMTTVVKVISMICAALAVAVAVQGYQVSKRSRHARLAVTLLAVPLFLTGLFGDGMVGSAAATFWCSGVAAAVLTLWLGPARAWFGDASPTLRRQQTPPSPRPTVPAGAPQSHTSLPFGTPTPPTAPPPPPPPTPPQQTSAPYAASPGSPWAPPPTSAYDVRRPEGGPPLARPKALWWACILTWLCTAIAATGLALSLTVLAVDSGSLLDEVYRQNPQLADQGLSRHAVLTMLVTICVVVLVVAAAAAVFAVLLFLHHPWAWYALVACAVAAALMFLIGSFGSPVAIVFLGACVATIACLVRPEVRAWLLRP